jgi:RXT2-like, N-terminal
MALGYGSLPSDHVQDIEYAGYKRRIVLRNSLAYDEDGDVVDDDDTEAIDPALMDDNPYKDIRLERKTKVPIVWPKLTRAEILRPLTAASDLPTHPRLSRPYLDKGLPEMIKQTEELLHKEQKSLWAVKALFVKFRGDSDWAPVGTMHTDYDDYLIAAACQGTSIANAEDAAVTWSGQSDLDSVREALRPSDSPSGDPAENKDLTDSIAAENQLLADSNMLGADQDATDEQRKGAKTNGTTPAANPSDENGADQPEANDDDAMDVDEPEQGVQTRRMATRSSQALVVQPSRSPSPTSVHPFYLAPPPAPPVDVSNPDEDPLGPLLSYISKQEEIVRSYSELHQGLTKALRMRSEVFSWCKAEGHVGEMSDGEDWVDLDEWGVKPGELIKGKEEDDNDNHVVETTRQRGRRARAADRERG